MAGTLTAITFAKATSESLQRDLQGHDNEDIYRGLIEDLQDLGHLGIKVQNLDSEYILRIETFLEKHTRAWLSLINAQDHEVIMQTELDMAPIIESGILLEDDYSNATMDYPVYDHDEDKCTEIAKKVQQLDQARYADINVILKPYIVSDIFNGELIKAIDLATRFYIEKNESRVAPGEAASFLSKFNMPKPD